MGYCTQADLEARYGAHEIQQITDRDNLGVADATAIARAIDDATAEIDAYLAGRHSLPLSTVPAVLNRLAADIARYHLYAHMATEEVRTRYKDAIRLLEQIAAGTVTLGTDPPPATHPGGGVGHVTPGRACPTDALERY